MSSTRVFYSCCGKRFNRNNRTEAELLGLYGERIKTCPDYIEMNREKKLLEEKRDKEYKRRRRKR